MKATLNSNQRFLFLYRHFPTLFTPLFRKMVNEFRKLRISS